jgi:hypothetical protein
MVAAGMLLAFTIDVGRTDKVDGATPNEHVIIAPLTTSCGIAVLLCCLHGWFYYRANAIFKESKNS